MDTDRPQLYYFLLPFTIVSLFLYAHILVEIYRKQDSVMYDSLFFRLTCSQVWPYFSIFSSEANLQSIYEISYVIMYFVMELTQVSHFRDNISHLFQDWPSLYPYYLIMNDTIIPQLIYAHVFMCLIAQVRTFWSLKNDGKSFGYWPEKPYPIKYNVDPWSYNNVRFSNATGVLPSTLPRKGSLFIKYWT